MIRAEVQKTLLREIFSLVFFFNDSYFNSQNHIMGIIAHDRTSGFMVPPSAIFCRCYIQTEKALLNKYFTKKDRFHTINIFRQTFGNVSFHRFPIIYITFCGHRNKQKCNIQKDMVRGQAQFKQKENLFFT